MTEDDGSAMGGTLPVNLGTTQLSPSKKRPSRPDPLEHRPWLMVGILAGAVVLGFALGAAALTIALLR
jgi:hypothetical protein